MNKIKLAFFTTSRSELGNMSDFIKYLKKDKRFKIYLFVGGAHFLKSFGNTFKEIKDKSIRITKTFKFFSNKNKLNDISNQLLIAQKELNKIFFNYDFKYVILFGDRYELLPIVNNSILYKKKLIHFGGGEITEGAIDNKVRNVISSIANLHFTSAEIYRKNLIKKNIKSKYLFNAGTFSNSPIKNKKKNNSFLRKFNLEKNFALMTYHSATLISLKENMRILKNIFSFLKKKKMKVIITAPNKEIYSDKILLEIKKNVKKDKNFFFFPSLGNNLFKFVLKKSKFIIGNSSACVILAPFYKIPSINVGARQTGRVMHSNVINAKGSQNSLEKSFEKLNSTHYKNSIKNLKFKFKKNNQFLFVKNKIINYARKNEKKISLG